MATLTETAYYSRNIVKYGLSALVGLVILRGLLIVGIGVYKKIFPPPPPPPTVKYGKLTRISGPVLSDLPGTITLTLETPDGTTRLTNFKERGLPDPLQAKVFFMPAPNPNLLTLERAKERAVSLGFSGEPELLSDGVYRFRDAAVYMVLDIHSTTLAFRMYRSAEVITAPGGKIDSTDQALSIVRGQLGNLLTDDVNLGRAEYSFYKEGGGGLTPVGSLSEAQFVRVDMFRQDLDELPVYTTYPDEGVIWGIVAGGVNQAVELNFRYFPIEKEEFSTYPIKTADDAWRELGEGKGYFAKLGQNQDGNIVVRRVYLAYYDNLNATQKFMQPVYVFEGDQDFVGYVPAVGSDWIE